MRLKPTQEWKKNFVIRKYQGDDIYSWAVFRKGDSRPCCTGCGKKEAEYHARKLQNLEEIEKT